MQNEKTSSMCKDYRQIRDALRSKDYELSSTLIRSALADNPREPLLWGWLCDAQRETGRYDEAISSAEQALALAESPGEVRLRALWRVGSCCFKYGREADRKDLLERAKVALQEFLESPPDDVMLECALVYLAMCELRLGNRSVAIAHYRTVLDHNPHNDDALFNLAMILRHDDREECERLLRTVCDLDIAHADGEAAFRLAKLLLRKDQPHEAEQVMRRYLSVAPGDKRALAELAHIISEGKEEEAVALARSALAQEPSYVPALQLLGGILTYRRQDWPEAERLLRKAIDLGEMGFMVILPLVNLLSFQRRYDEAERLAMDLKARMPDLAEAYALLGWVYLASNRSQLAVPELEQAVAIDPTDPDTLFALGRALCNSGQAVRGKEILEQVIAAGPEYAADVKRYLGE